MTEVAIPEQDAGRTPAVRPSAGVVSLADWAEEARAAYQLAAVLCKTAFAPEHFRNKPEEGTAAILTGREMGMSPMASLRAIFVIKGTPGMYANAMRAVVQSKGHDIWEEPGASAEQVVMRGRRAGTDKVQESVWTIERAKTADLMNNTQYRKNPKAMLAARATAEVCRLVAADALHGIAYAVEELDDFEPRKPEPVAAPRVTAKEILGQPEPPAAEPEPASEPEQPADEALWPEPARIPGGGQ